MKPVARKQGFLKILLVIIAAALILGYFKIDLKSTIESPTNQENAAYVKEKSTTLWEKYLEKPLTYFWKNIFVNLLWDAFVENMNRIKEGKPTNFEMLSPSVAPAVPPAPVTPGTNKPSVAN